MIRILVLSFYYIPDVGPAPRRVAGLVSALAEALPDDCVIQVFTTHPNRYLSHQPNAVDDEQDRMISVRRFTIPRHSGTMWSQAISYFYFVYKVINNCRRSDWDVVFATSSRLMTAILAFMVAKKASAKLYLDIRDLFSDTIGHVVGGVFSRFLGSIVRSIEKFILRKADKVNVVSEGFIPYLAKYMDTDRISCHTNGIDDLFLGARFAKKYRGNEVLYAGNIGEGQGLHHVIPEAAEFLAQDALFNVVGDGSAASLLARSVKNKKLDNVVLIPTVSPHDLLDYYQRADILLLHLNDYEAFQKVLPSKIFEYAATGKPILAGVSGYAKKFLQDYVPGVVFFNPCDSRALIEGLMKIRRGPTHFDRSQFCLDYARQRINMRMAKDVISLLG